MTERAERWELLPGRQAGQVDLHGEWPGGGCSFANLNRGVAELLVERLRVRYEPVGLIIQHQGKSWIQRMQRTDSGRPGWLEELRSSWMEAGAAVTVLYVKEEE